MTMALVDCNNFYASCERIFRPDLQRTPIVVLSNNDGCVIARSAEAKALGIPMAAPVFQIRDILKKNHVQVFSSNFPLYADISQRVMQLLEDWQAEIEIYSIDEAFLHYATSPTSWTDEGTQLQRHLQQCLGISTSIGFAPTKTLAKLANYAAKKYPATKGIVDLSCPQRQQKLMALTAIEDVWGIGKRMIEPLHHMGIRTALDLANQPAKIMRQRFSVVIERIIHELNGTPCYTADSHPSAKKQILCSRSFQPKITDSLLLHRALADFTVRAAEKLRETEQSCRHLSIYIANSRFDTSSARYSNSASYALPQPTNDTRILLRLVQQLLEKIWKDHIRYAKAGVILSDLYPEGTYFPELFPSSEQAHATIHPALMHTIDALNRRQHGLIRFATQGFQKKKYSLQEHRSPAYTTRWTELPKVY